MDHHATCGDAWWSVETGTLEAHAGIDASALTRRRGVARDVDVVDEQDATQEQQARGRGEVDGIYVGILE